MVAFTISAILTLAASIIAIQLHDDLPTFFLLKFFRRTSAIRDFWILVLDRLILGFSDQQLVTGLAVLIIGLSRIDLISTYHFYVIESLAMFSCGCHMASVVTLRRYFQEHPLLASIRVGAMLIFAILLSVSMLYAGTTLSDEININLPCPLRCTATSQSGITRFVALILTFLLIFAYYSALAYVFPGGTVAFQSWLVTKPIVFLELALQSISGGHCGYQFHESFRHWRAPVNAIGFTFFCQCLWSLVSFSAAMIVKLRGEQVLSGSENDWSFGQILAVLMIVLPFLGAAEVYIGN